MTNIRRLLVSLLFAALFFTACKDKCDKDAFAIESLQPAANPAGYEVFIKANGVSGDTKVYFDDVEAASVQTAEGGLIVKVPTGLSGTVALLIEEGECKDSKSFEVLGSYPGNVPASPTTIIIPQAPGSLPSGITNGYQNIADPAHLLVLSEDGQSGVLNEFSVEYHSNNSFFNNNQISGNYNQSNNSLFLVIDRSAKTGGYKDTLTGQFIPNFPQVPTATYTFLLTSKRTGRQIVAYRE